MPEPGAHWQLPSFHGNRAYSFFFSLMVEMSSSSQLFIMVLSGLQRYYFFVIFKKPAEIAKSRVGNA
jgi:hypothetical protein